MVAVKRRRGRNKEEKKERKEKKRRNRKGREELPREGGGGLCKWKRKRRGEGREMRKKRGKKSFLQKIYRLNRVNPIKTWFNHNLAELNLI